MTAAMLACFDDDYIHVVASVETVIFFKFQNQTALIVCILISTFQFALSFTGPTSDPCTSDHQVRPWSRSVHPRPGPVGRCPTKDPELEVLYAKMFALSSSFIEFSRRQVWKKEVAQVVDYPGIHTWIVYIDATWSCFL